MTALQAAHRQDYARAEKMCRAHIQHNPDDASAYDALGMILLDMKKPEAAEQCFRQALNLEADIAAYRMHLCVALSTQFLDEAAAAVAAELVTLFPRHAPFLVNWGHAAARRYDTVSTREAFSRARALDPRNVNIVIASGQAFANLGATHDAIAAFAHALEMDRSKIGEFGLYYAELLAAVGRAADGLKVCEEIIARHAHEPKARLLLALYYDKRGQRSDAVALLQTVVTDAPDYALAWAELGRHEAAQGNWHNAVRHFKKAAKIAPNDTGYRALINDAELSQKKYAPQVVRGAELPPHISPRSGDTTIVVRGAVDASYINTIKHYRAAHPDAFIILSTWKDTREDLIQAVSSYCDDIVLNARPAMPGINHINFQIVCAAAGVNRAAERGYEKILLTRTDLALLRPRLLDQLSALHQQYDDSIAVNHGMKGRLIVSDMYTLSIPHYHVSDMFIYGFTSDIQKYWSLDYMTDCCLRPESILCRSFAKTIKRDLENSLPDMIALMRDFFIVHNSTWFEFYWTKNPACLQPAYMVKVPVINQAVWENSLAK